MVIPFPLCDRLMQRSEDAVKQYTAQPIATAPKDGSVVRVAVAMRWRPYKPASEKYRHLGIKGRWQEFVSGLGWRDALDDPEEWMAPTNAEVVE